MPTPIYDTGDPGDVVGTPPPPAGSPPPGGDGGSPPPPGGSGHQKHPIQPKTAHAGSSGAVGGWRDDYQATAFGAPAKAHPTELLTAHSRAKVVAEPVHASVGSSPGSRVLQSTWVERPRYAPSFKRSKADPRSISVDTGDDNHRKTKAPHIAISPEPDRLAVSIGSKTFVNKPVKFAVHGDRLTITVEGHRAVVSLSAKEKGDVAKLRRSGIGGDRIVSPLLTVMAAKIAGLPLSLACAILQRETPPGGRNEWGHDSPKIGVPGAIFTGGYDAAHKRQYPETPVTQAAYRAYKSERGPETGGVAPHQQGVGPGQLTSAWKQDQADMLGGAWRSLPNMIEAFALLRTTIQRDGLRATVVAYNGRGAPAEAYADAVLADERQWAQMLGVQSMQTRH
jgi:hypothetical protein